jgi:hypothetical protein
VVGGHSGAIVVFTVVLAGGVSVGRCGVVLYFSRLRVSFMSFLSCIWEVKKKQSFWSLNVQLDVNIVIY